MNSILLENISTGTVFSEDAYILDDLFFLPKNFPVHDYHIKILKQWSIDNILTNGQATEGGIEALEKEKEFIKKTDQSKLKENDLGKILRDKLEQAEDAQDFTKSKIDTTALLDGSIKNFLEIYKIWIKKIFSFFNDIITKNSIDKDQVKIFLFEIMANINKNRNNALMLFGKKFENIMHVYPQTLETIILSYIIGDSLNLGQLEIFNLLVATLFHDLGMLKVPRVILDKKESLTQQEISTIKEHTILGFNLLRDVKYSPIIASGALQHHERIDGMGYPNGITGEKITGIAKIVTIVDAYAAAIASKPYKETSLHGKEVIQDLLRAGGSAYEPSILKELIKNISFYPIGSLIILSDTKIARVVGTSGVPMKPIVRLTDESNSDTDVIDLSKRDDLYIKELYNKKTE